MSFFDLARFIWWPYAIEALLFFLLGLVILVLAVWALVDCLRHKESRFTQEGKRTKGFWTGLTAASVAVAVLSTLFGSSLGLFQLLAACIACVYLADVKPAVSGKGGWYY